jgi:hypothetical protein
LHDLPIVAGYVVSPILHVGLTYAAFLGTIHYSLTKNKSPSVIERGFLENPLFTSMIFLQLFSAFSQLATFNHRRVYKVR